MSFTDFESLSQIPFTLWKKIIQIATTLKVLYLLLSTVVREGSTLTPSMAGPSIICSFYKSSPETTDVKDFFTACFR